MLAQDPSIYFENWVGQVRSSDRLLVVFDPEVYLDLGDELHLASQVWRVYRYAENDLSFRAAYSSRPADPNFRHIVWVTPSPLRRARRSTLDLSFMADVLRRADQILDLSLAGLLRGLVPGEVFPEQGLQAYGHILSTNLETLLVGYHDVRQEIGRRQPLDIHHVRALALHCLQPEISVSDFLFSHSDARSVLRHYLRLIWSGQFADETLALLREHAIASCQSVGGRPIEHLHLWFEASPSELALLVYTYRALQRFGVSNPVNQLRGLGLLTTDPSPLVPELDTALELWEEKPLCAQIVQRAEASFDPNLLADLISLFPLPDLPAVSHALRHETTPALIYGLAERFLSMALQEGTLDKLRTGMLPPATSTADAKTAYSERAQALLSAMHGIAFVHEGLRHSFEPLPDLAGLADWYVENHIYRLELARSLAEEQAKALTSVTLHRKLQAYLDHLLKHIWSYLDQVDENLSDLVKEGYEAFLGHPRLSTHVLHNTIIETGFQPTQEHCVWILVFDGMRWDSWKEIVLPALTEHLEIVDEGKVYLSLLPSFTSVARTGLLAGGAPHTWRGANGRYTSNEAILAARLFDLDQVERDRWLRLEVSSETDLVQRRLGGDFDRRPVNILVYNISDHWIHNFQGSLTALNQAVAQQMQSVAVDLWRCVREGDLVIVTSDHGFVELDPEANIPISDKELREQGIEATASKHVFYRYLVDLEHSNCLRVPFQGDRFYTVAQGRSWFQRGEAGPSRYTHGGISMGEMVVPGAIMQRITEPSVRLALSSLPRRLEVLEKEPQTVSVSLENIGNRATEYTIAFATNTEPEGKTTRGSLGPRAAQRLSYTFTPVYRPKATDRLIVHITYRDVDEGEKRMPTRSASIVTMPRKDVVEIDFGGLDQLDEF